MRTHQIEPRRAKTNAAATLPPRIGRLLTPLLAGVALLLSAALFAQKATTQPPAPPAKTTPAAASKPRPAAKDADHREEDERRADLVARWRDLADVKFEDAHSLSDYLRIAKEAEDLHLEFGDFPLGRVNYTDSSSYFHSADLVPRLLTAYCYWKAAREDGIEAKERGGYLTKVETLLFPLMENADKLIIKNRYFMYEFPSVVAMYIDCILDTGDVTPKLIDQLRLLEAGREKYALRKNGKKTEAFRSAELAAMSSNGKGVPLLLAARLTRDEEETVASIKNRLNAAPQFTPVKTDLLTAAPGERPLAAGEVRYPLPLDIEARDAQGNRLGPVAPGARGEMETEIEVARRSQNGQTAPLFIGKFAIPLDNRKAGAEGELHYHWRVRAADAPFLTAFLGKAPEGDAALSDPAARRYHFAPSDASTGGAAKEVPAIITDISAGRVWTTAQPVAFTLSTTGAKQIGWQLVRADGSRYPEKAALAPLTDGRAQIEIPAGILAAGMYALRARADGQAAGHAAPSAWQDAQKFAVVGNRSAAFIVGIDYYTGGASLNDSCADAGAFEKMLVERFGYDPANVVYLYGRAQNQDGEITIATPSGDIKQSAEAAVLLQSFNRFLRLVVERDISNVIIFYAGHGFTIEKQDKILGADMTSIPMKELLTQLAVGAEGAAEQGRTIIGFFDACRKSENGQVTQFHPQEQRLYNTAAKYVSVLSCDDDQISNENAPPDSPLAITYQSPAPFEHGFFTWALLKSMEELKPVNGIVRLPDLLRKVNEKMGAIMTLARAANTKAPSASEDEKYATPQDVTSKNRDVPALVSSDAGRRPEKQNNP